jgi:hypothetical protein
MILNENDRKCFSLTYTRRTIRLQLNLLNESDNHQSVIETLNAIRCLLLLVTHDNVHLIDFNQLGTILDKYVGIRFNVNIRDDSSKRLLYMTNSFYRVRVQKFSFYRVWV